MKILDVNILVYSFRSDSSGHLDYKNWLEQEVDGAEGEPLGISELVVSGFLRIVTHPKIFQTPTPVQKALHFTRDLMARPNVVRLRPKERHWDIFIRLCEQTAAKGNEIPDAYHAALAIEHNCEWITTDKGFDKYPGLRWRHPLR